MASQPTASRLQLHHRIPHRPRRHPLGIQVPGDGRALNLFAPTVALSLGFQEPGDSRASSLRIYKSAAASTRDHEHHGPASRTAPSDDPMADALTKASLPARSSTSPLVSDHALSEGECRKWVDRIAAAPLCGTPLAWP